MRNLLLGCILLNLLAYAYQHWIIEPAVRVDALSIDQSFPRLQLVNPAARAPAPPAAALPASVRCLRIGPFLRADAAETVRQSLTQRGILVRQSAEEGQVWVGHWVQVRVAGSRAEAESIRDRLRSAGLRDAYIVSSDDQRLISLGVFRLLSSANAAAQKARDLGIEPLVVERYQPGTNFWLAARLRPDQRLEAGELTGSAGQIVRSEQVPCAAEPA
ncbi:MAG: SPOR domain-containing protein [Gammaproteobacteria bacterium]|jgi:hypothetical protein|nr:SPOR domain-containing protein [Gammaproteobacteria bacterium]